jgi:hypothetical protein
MPPHGTDPNVRYINALLKTAVLTPCTFRHDSCKLHDARKVKQGNMHGAKGSGFPCFG